MKNKVINYNYRKKIVELTLSQIDQSLVQQSHLKHMSQEELWKMSHPEFKGLIMSSSNLMHKKQKKFVFNERVITDIEEANESDITPKVNITDTVTIGITNISTRRNKKLKKVCHNCNLEIDSSVKRSRFKATRKGKFALPESSVNKLCDSIIRFLMNVGIVKTIRKILGYGPKIEQEVLSYKKLHRMIETYHPTNPETHEKFSPFDSITVYNYGLKLTDACGVIKVVQCCNLCKSKVKRCLNLKGEKKFKRPDTMADLPDSDSSDDPLKNDTYKGLSEAAIYLGEGTILYLQMMKTLAILFLILTVVNIPLYILLQGGTRGNNFKDIVGALDYFTIGNLALPEEKCTHSHLLYDKSQLEYSSVRKEGSLTKPDKDLSDLPLQSIQPNIELQCGHPSYYLRSIEKIGFIQTLDYVNQRFFSAEVQCKIFEDDSHSPEQQFKDKKQEAQFDKLKLLPELYLEEQPLAIDEECKKKSMFKSEDDYNTFMRFFDDSCLGKNKCTLDFSKLNIHELISSSCLKRIFNEQKIRPEFLMITQCKSDYTSIRDMHKETIGLIAVVSDIIGVCLVYYFFRKLKQINQEYLFIIDSNIIKMSSFTIQLDNLILDKSMQDMRMLKMKIWLHFQKVLDRKAPGQQVVDVQLSISTLPKQMVLWQLQKIREVQANLIQKLHSGQQSHQSMAEITNQLKKMEEKDERVTRRWNEYCVNEQFNKPVVQVSKYQWIDSIDHIWITFKSSKSPSMVQNALKPEHPIVSCFRTFCCIKNPDQNLIEINGQKIQVKKTVEPDQIIWANLKYSNQEQRRRAYIVFVISILTVVSVIVITTLSDFANGQISGPDCAGSEDSFEKVYIFQNAFMNLRKVQKRDEELPVILSPSMFCFCEKLTDTGKQFWMYNAVQVYVKNYSNDDDTPYCWMYLRNKIVIFLATKVANATSAIINSVIAFIFGYMGHFLVRHTTIETQVTSFSYILILEYVNMGIIQLIQAFEPTKMLKELAGDDTDYEGFDYRFYKKIGSNLTGTILLSVVFTNIGEIQKLAKILLKRLIDRGFRLNIKKDLEDEDDDEPNSRKKTQEELEQLYMGEEFEGQSSYSRMMSHLMVLIAFSSGMPILYFVGFVFFAFTFMVEKWNLILFLQKTTTLNRIIPTYSTGLFNLVILQHLLIGGFMMTNPNIFEAHGDEEDIIKLPDAVEQLKDKSAILSARFQYIHQKLYFAFIIVAITLHLAGSFLKGLIIIIYEQIKNLVNWIIEKVLIIINRIKACVNRGKNSNNKVLTKDSRSSSRIVEILPQEEKDEESFDLSDLSNQNAQNARKMNPYQFFMYAKETCPIPEKTEPTTTPNESKLSVKRMYTTKNIITSSLVLIQKFAHAIKFTINQQKKAENQISPAEQKRIKDMMAKFKLLSLEPNASENIYSELKITYLIKFYKRAQKEFEEIQHFFNIDDKNSLIILTPVINKFIKKDPLRITFEEICYTNKITEEEVKTYLGLLEQRIQDIEEVIDTHIELARDELIQQRREQLLRKIKKEQELEDSKKKQNQQLEQQTNPDDPTSQASEKSILSGSNALNRLASLLKDQYKIVEDRLKEDPELQFDSFSYKKKLDVLYEYETNLLNADKKQPMNRKGIQTICRMTGSISQSYFLLDQEKYDMASKIYYNEVQQPQPRKKR